MKPIKNSELIEIQLHAGVKLYKLPTQTNFKGKKIVGISMVTAFSEDLQMVSPLGKKVAGMALIGNAYITLDVMGREKVKQMNLLSISLSVIASSLYIDMDGFIINNDKSYIEFSSTSGITGDESILLNIFFED